MLSPDKEDEVLARIEAGEMLTVIARSLGVDRANFMKWLNADELRSARVRDARISASAAWDEKAEEEIAAAQDPFELSRAKELAHHYRWRASKIAPKLYGDKVSAELTGADGGPIKTEDMTPNEIARRIAFALAMGAKGKGEVKD